MEKLTACSQTIRDLNWYRLLGIDLDMHLKCSLSAIATMENKSKEVIKDVGRAP